MPGNHIDTGSQNLLGKVEKKRMINAQTSFKHSNLYRQENILILLVIINFFFFPSLRAGGIFQILQYDWFREQAVFYDLAR